MKPLKIALSLFLYVALLFVSLAQIACSQDLNQAIGDVVSYAEDVSQIAQAAFPNEGEKLADVTAWIARARLFQQSFAKTRTPEEYRTRVTELADLITAFEQSIAPLIKLSPLVTGSIVALDASLRLFSRKLLKKAADVAPAEVVKATAKAHADLGLQKAFDTINRYLNSSPLRAS